MYVYLPLFLSNQVRSLSQPLNHKFLSFSPAVDVLDIIGSSLKVAGCVVALGDEDVVVDTALQWLVQWDRWSLKVSVDIRFI
jgi:hypothetical protein